MATEEWRPVPGWPYEVSDMGRVRRCRDGHCTYKGRVKKPSVDGGGYMLVSLHRNGTRKSYKVHRLVVEAFLPKPDDPTVQCNHKNGNKKDNRLKNLEWATPSENSQHAVDMGLTPRPAFAKLTPLHVRNIRVLYGLGLTIVQIGRLYGMGHSSMSKAIRGSTWGDVAENSGIRRGSLSSAGRVRRWCPGAILNEAEVVEIRERYARGGISMLNLGREYGVAEKTVRSAVHGATWKHVGGPVN